MADAAAAVAVVYSLLVSLFIYRGIRLKELPKLFYEAGRSTAVILFLLAAAWWRGRAAPQELCRR